jgi:hypothetical protein
MILIFNKPITKSFCLRNSLSNWLYTYSSKYFLFKYECIFAKQTSRTTLTHKINFWLDCDQTSTVNKTLKFCN